MISFNTRLSAKQNNFVYYFQEFFFTFSFWNSQIVLLLIKQNASFDNLKVFIFIHNIISLNLLKYKTLLGLS